MGPRSPGSPGHRRAGDWIAEELRRAGWQVEIQPFDHEGTALRNIIGRAEGGSWPPEVLLGAHYDTRPIAERDPVRPQQPVPGANDGASGVAVLLELARVLPPELRRGSVGFVFFDAEDSGGPVGWPWALGARRFAEGLEAHPGAVIVLDMVGDADLDLYYERTSDPMLSQAIWSTAAKWGFSQFIPELRYAVIDDHTPFLERGIPAVDIIDFDYPPWHTTQDTLDKISPQSLEAVGRTLQEWLVSQK